MRHRARSLGTAPWAHPRAYSPLSSCRVQRAGQGLVPQARLRTTRTNCLPVSCSAPARHSQMTAATSARVRACLWGAAAGVGRRGLRRHGAAAAIGGASYGPRLGCALRAPSERPCLLPPRRGQARSGRWWCSGIVAKWQGGRWQLTSNDVAMSASRAMRLRAPGGLEPVQVSKAHRAAGKDETGLTCVRAKAWLGGVDSRLAREPPRAVGNGHGPVAGASRTGVQWGRGHRR